ncbi:elicitor-responsive protein 1-like isoform X1 [Olea europaea var. sylvestris]|uniref:elicitor-responsive protein 1-like isoform X1 n=1 Tax=Olea europaea var. sylvestris TaxID=158386 RepID=UPI000C1D41F8|nr:elicitor-responsive protein 1-like isoform X1 [Olea europaea var. sylvestris]
MAIGIMEVKLVSAKSLKNTDFLGGIDPYVLLQYRKQEFKSTVAKGTSPVWNEKFEFRVDSPLTDDNQYELVLKIMDHDTFSADDYLGQATIYVKDLIKIGVEEGKAEIHPQKYRVVSTDQIYYGEIQVGITFTAKQKTVEEEEEEYGGWKESDY